MAERAAHAGGNEQEVETLSADEYLKLLKLLKIQLPKGVLTLDAIAQSTCPNIIEDAMGIKQDLRKGTLCLAQTPRLACGNIQQTLQLKEKDKFQDITKMIFFRTQKGSLTEQWKKKWKPGSGFQIRATYRETSSAAVGNPSHKPFYGEHSIIQTNAKQCYDFYLKQTELKECDVKTKKNGKLEFGFLTGKPSFLVAVKRSEDVTEKIIMKCNSSSKDMAEEIFTLPKEGGQPEFNTSHQYYLHTQGCLFILKEKEKMEENPVPVRAVMVMKTGGNFYCGEVSEDREKIEQLNNLCKNEALPRFLAVLNLIFEKEN
ncbi:uncharacterized protein LOC132886355 [Neoarius graeffei]|uniref:uncharacterized protein LOC132886355 n=1 Tax=Neoarius graeffei TaxID=443677 RepID=UPI00298BD736|nr:uncharacterized protein LOC132886355 [Neoarius graeffei]